MRNGFIAMASAIMVLAAPSLASAQEGAAAGAATGAVVGGVVGGPVGAAVGAGVGAAAGAAGEDGERRSGTVVVEPGAPSVTQRTRDCVRTAGSETCTTTEIRR